MPELNDRAVLIARAVEEWLISEKWHGDYLPLATLMGCHYVDFVKGEWTLCNAPAIDASAEIAVGTALLQIIRSYDPDSAMSGWVARTVLHRLLDCDHWRSFMATEDDVYVFAVFVARFFNPYHVPAMVAGDKQLWELTRVKLYHELKEWLPEYTESTQFDARTFASALFGEAWCALVYDAMPRGLLLPDLIASTHPPFLPGRLGVDRAEVPLALPALA
jgi:hypothetical protein